MCDNLAMDTVNYLKELEVQNGVVASKLNETCRISAYDCITAKPLYWNRRN
jgi:hypothetical protein